MIKVHEEEYFEIQVQDEPPQGDWRVSPRARYDDLYFAADWARALQAEGKTVRIRHTMLDYYDPAMLANEPEPS
jgi:hypothetical protein